MIHTISTFAHCSASDDDDDDDDDKIARETALLKPEGPGTGELAGDTNALLVGGKLSSDVQLHLLISPSLIKSSSLVPGKSSSLESERYFGDKTGALVAGKSSSLVSERYFGDKVGES